jgi:hypothetical protein
MTKTVDAKGWSDGKSANVKIAVTMPRQDFEALRDKAAWLKKSISAVIREYVNTGILVDKDMGEWPPTPCVIDISRAPILQELLAREPHPEFSSGNAVGNEFPNQEHSAAPAQSCHDIEGETNGSR